MNNKEARRLSNSTSKYKCGLHEMYKKFPELGSALFSVFRLARDGYDLVFLTWDDLESSERKLRSSIKKRLVKELQSLGYSIKVVKDPEYDSGGGLEISW